MNIFKKFFNKIRTSISPKIIQVYENNYDNIKNEDLKFYKFNWGNQIYRLGRLKHWEIEPVINNKSVEIYGWVLQ